MNETVVVLAAGASSRFGGVKQISDWRGKPLVRFVVEEALAVSDDVRVAIGAHGALVWCALEGLPCRRVEVARWEDGPGASLKEALAAAPLRAGVLVTLADLPLVERHHFARLLSLDAPLIAASFDGVVGPPAVFRGPFIDALRAIDDTRGARHLLERHRADLTRVALPEAAFDVDTSSRLERLREDHGAP